MNLQQLLAITGNKALVHRKTGLSLTTLHKIQKGISVPKADTYQYICEALGVKKEELYANENYSKEN